MPAVTVAVPKNQPKVSSPTAPPKPKSVLDVTAPAIDHGQQIADAVEAYIFAWEGRMDPQKIEAKAKLAETINAALEPLANARTCQP